MRAAQRTVEAKLVFKFRKILEAGPGDYAAHTMANKINDDIFLIHETSNVVFYLIGQFLAHSLNVRLSVVLIFARKKVVGVGQLGFDAFVDHCHIVRAPLKAVAKND